MNAVKCSWSISCISVQLKTKVFETNSVTIIRVDDGHRRSLQNVIFNRTLMWLIARENFLAFLEQLMAYQLFKEDSVPCH
jgi:hypothetical protein